jgi:isopenicillin-N epimerase
VVPYEHASTWRAQFALEPGLAFLNHGSFGAVPLGVRAAQDALRDELERDPVAMFEGLAPRMAAARARVAEALGTAAERLAFVDNATTGVAAALRATPLRAGDRVVITDHTYGAVRLALRDACAAAGATLEVVAVPFPIEDPSIVLDAVLPRIPGARLVLIDAITSPTGLRLPFEQVVAAARAAGVAVIVDGAHAPMHLALDLDALDADFFTGNLHKWAFAPRGTAVLRVSDRRRHDARPLVTSWEIDQGFPASFDFSGTRDPSAWLAAPAGLDFAARIGGDALRAHNDRLCAEMASSLSSAWGVAIPSPASMRAHLATLPLPRRPPAEAAAAIHRALRRRGVQVPCVPFGERAWIRVSAQVYVSRADVERLERAVPDVLDELGL